MECLWNRSLLRVRGNTCGSHGDRAFELRTHVSARSLKDFRVCSILSSGVPPYSRFTLKRQQISIPMFHERGLGPDLLLPLHWRFVCASFTCRGFYRRLRRGEWQSRLQNYITKEKRSSTGRWACLTRHRNSIPKSCIIVTLCFWPWAAHGWEASKMYGCNQPTSPRLLSCNRGSWSDGVHTTWLIIVPWLHWTNCTRIRSTSFA